MHKEMGFDPKTGAVRYRIGQRVVTREEWNASFRTVPPNYAKGECPQIAPEREHMPVWNPQLAKNTFDRTPNEHNTFTSTRDLVRKGLKRGLAPVETSDREWCE